MAGYFICVYVFLHGSSAEEGTAEEKELTGTIDEIKDFMFVVTDENDTPYSFTFEEKPEGLENVSNGDTVTVKYTVIVEFGSNKNCRIPMQKAAISAVEKPEDVTE